MSEQHSPAKTPLPTEHPRWLKIRRDKGPALTVDDFPVGHRFVGCLKEGNGFTTFVLCEIVDRYACKALAGWYSPVIVHARMVRVTEQKHAGLVGHLTKVNISNDTWFSRDGMRLTDLPEDQQWI